MDKTKVRKLVEEMEQMIMELKQEMEAVEEVTDVTGDAEQLLFDVRCLEDNGKAVECGDWIYYINQIDDIECGDIWKVRTNGEDNQLLLEYSNATEISKVDGKWIYYESDEGSRQVTIYGKMDQESAVLFGESMNNAMSKLGINL